MLFNRLNGIINFNTNPLNYLINNKHFIINYSKKLGRPEWAIYSLNANDLKKCKGGRRSFIYDQELISNSIYQLSPYSNIFKNQWTRAHLIPSFIMSWDKGKKCSCDKGKNCSCDKGIKCSCDKGKKCSCDKGKNSSWDKTYSMSNVIPQHKMFNMIKWQQLEIQTSKIISQHNQNVHVITGCTNFDYSNKIYFNNKIPHLRLINPKYSVVWIDEKNNFEYQIPNLMYQVIITPNDITCWIGSNYCKQNIYQVSIDYLEKIIGTKLLL